ncbi:MAG: threonine dehydratase [Flavobacteriaceae bacterium TMED208]|nr:MAG: threonine dehydratase [Flavobacteriaceae bacterium TMED208]
MINHPSFKGVESAAKKLKGLTRITPLEFNKRLSKNVNASVFLKREDLQQVRSFKIRGAYNKISSLKKEEIKKGIICASAGNHAQGFAFSCQKLEIKGEVYMPATTPDQKVSQVRMFGGEFVDIILVGDSYDACQKVALDAAKDANKTFIHPFDDPEVIEGQGTIALEMLDQYSKGFDYVLVPLGGGGLISGMLTVFKKKSPNTKVIGIEPDGAASMKLALEKGKRISLESMDYFVDGAAVRQVGRLPFKICKEHLDQILVIPEGKICQTILEVYNKDGIVAEPAGALAIAALNSMSDKIKNKSIGVLVCGGNNDIFRMPEIKERALLYAELKHYFLVDFPQRSGALKQFVTEILGPNDDITHFEFSKKHFRNSATAVVGIELKEASDLTILVERMKKYNFKFDYINDKKNLFQVLI